MERMKKELDPNDIKTFFKVLKRWLELESKSEDKQELFKGMKE